MTRVLLPELRRNKDTARLELLGTEVARHSQEQLTQILHYALVENALVFVVPKIGVVPPWLARSMVSDREKVMVHKKG